VAWVAAYLAVLGILGVWVEVMIAVSVTVVFIFIWPLALIVAVPATFLLIRAGWVLTGRDLIKPDDQVFWNVTSVLSVLGCLATNAWWIEARVTDGSMATVRDLDPYFGALGVVMLIGIPGVVMAACIETLIEHLPQLRRAL
jgi:hypothetical protein